jgi:ribose transport system permease protein
MSVETKVSVEAKKSDEAIAAAAQLAASKRQARMGTLLSLTLVALLALMWMLLAFSTESFWTYNNISNLLRQGSMIAILAMGETFVIITAGIDLSVGAVVGFTSVIVAWFLAHGFPIWAAILITLAFGFAIGTFHAFGISKLGLPPFIMTLATLTALRGIGLLITNGATISITNTTFTGFSRGDFLGVPNLFWMVILVAGNATQGEGWELQAIASSVIGGTSLFGAVGSVHGPLLGSFILTTINNGANLLNVNAFWQRIITGVLIIVIVYFDGLRAKKR